MVMTDKLRQIQRQVAVQLETSALLAEPEAQETLPAVLREVIRLLTAVAAEQLAGSA
jgi:hypothetical protein